MAKFSIPALVQKGASYYWQPSKTLAAAGWDAMALGKDFAEARAIAEKRNREVARWKLGGQAPHMVTPRAVKHSFGELVALYRTKRLRARKPSRAIGVPGTPLYSDKTKEIYETSLVRLEAWAGKRPLSWITRRQVEDLRDTSLATIGHAATFALLKMLRVVLRYGVDQELLASNPAQNFELGPPPPRRLIWEAEDEAAFIAAAYELGLPTMALALELAIYTAQRAGDLLRWNEPQVQELKIFDPAVRALFAGDDGRVLGWCFAQRKTSDDYADTEMQIPLEPGFRARVEAVFRDNRARDRAAEPPRLITRLLVNPKTGLPWTNRGFSRAWSDVLEHAAERTQRPHMLELVWHDLRRTRVVRLRRRGMEPARIAAITGHSPRAIEDMLKVYGPVDPTMTAAAIASTLEAPIPLQPQLSRLPGKEATA